MSAYGLTIIRIGLAGVMLWFGWAQVQAPLEWVGYVPEYVLSIVPLEARTFVLLNGSAEIAGGVLLALGIFVRAVALLLALHLALIALSLGNSAVAVRDWGLAAACLGLVFTGGGSWGMDGDA